MPLPPVHTSETIMRARQMYSEGARVRDICAATGLGVGTLYHHLDGLSLPGMAPPRLKRRRAVAGNATLPLQARGRRRLAARLWRAAESQARRIERSVLWGNHQPLAQRDADMAALREMVRILRDLAAFEDASFGPLPRRDGEAPAEHEAALAVEGRALYISRTRRR
jgi:hypothetical protein